MSGLQVPTPRSRRSAAAADLWRSRGLHLTDEPEIRLATRRRPRAHRAQPGWHPAASSRVEGVPLRAVEGSLPPGRRPAVNMAQRRTGRGVRLAFTLAANSQEAPRHQPSWLAVTQRGLMRSGVARRGWNVVGSESESIRLNSQNPGGQVWHLRRGSIAAGVSRGGSESHQSPVRSVLSLDPRSSTLPSF
jgi:hypothetical protein